MAKPSMKLDTKVGLGVAAIFAFFSVLLFGNAILKVAELTAQCMEEAHGAREATPDCSRVEPVYFWGPIGIVSGLGFFAAYVCFSNGRREGQKTLLEYLNKQQKISDVEKIVHAYAAAILSRKSLISDVSELPYPKPIIKAALIAAISVTKDAKMQEQLKSSYVSLADWQEGVGLGPYPFDTPKKEEILSMSDADALAVMKRIAAASPSYTDMTARVATEAQALLDELKALGL